MRKRILNESIQHKVDQVILTRRDKKVLFSLFIYKAYNAIGGDKLARLSYLSWGGGGLIDRDVYQRGASYTNLRSPRGRLLDKRGLFDRGVD